MFLRRCAWHRLYHRYGKFLGIASWRGWTVTFSDGLCERCADRVREEWGLPEVPPSPDERRLARWPAFPYATAALAASILFVLIGLASPPNGQARRTGDTGQPDATASAPTAAEVAQSNGVKGNAEVANPAASVSPHSALAGARPSAGSHGAATNPRSASGASDSAEGMGSPKHARAVSADASRVRGRVVRVSDRRGLTVASRVTPALVAVANGSATMPSMEPVLLFVATPPALVELQAP